MLTACNSGRNVSYCRETTCFYKQLSCLAPTLYFAKNKQLISNFEAQIAFKAKQLEAQPKTKMELLIKIMYIDSNLDK